MKSVLISIQPKWCELIANGKKTVEVRKTRPKLETPFKVYIYMTKSGNNFLGDGEKDWFVSHNFTMAGKVIGEFVCSKIELFDSAFDEWARSVAPPESCIDSMGWNKFEDIIHHRACMTDEDLNSYFPEDVKAYLWHISNLVIYDEPKELSEFHTVDKDAVRSCGHRHQSYCSAQCDSGYIKNGFYCDRTADWCTQCTTKPITRAPQSWCFVEELKQNEK